MFRTILYAIYYWGLLILSLILFMPYAVISLLGQKKFLNNYLQVITSAWARNVLWTAGIRVKIQGLNNLPDKDNVCFISNHQGYADIPLIMGYIQKTVGFVAKKELAYVPLLSYWMRALHCIFIDRNNKKQALKAIESGVHNIKQGYPMLIFPEGTRSKSVHIGKFKPGSLKIAVRSKAIVVPLTVNGTYKLLEEKGRVTPGQVSLTIHPAVDLAKLSFENKEKLADKLRQIISSGLNA